MVSNHKKYLLLFKHVCEAHIWCGEWFMASIFFTLLQTEEPAEVCSSNDAEYIL